MSQRTAGQVADQDAAKDRGPAPRLRALDALRFGAALSVVLFHFTARDNNAWHGPVRDEFPTLGHATAYGALGVYVFFLISGFVILMSAWGRTLPDFVASRVARLFPAFWFAVAVTGFLLLVIRPEIGVDKLQSLGFKDAVANLSMAHSAVGVPDVDGVYWTLWVELKFYVIIAILLYVGLTRARVLALATLWPIIAQVAERADNRLLIELLSPDYAPLFALGMVLFLIHREGPSAATLLVAGLNWTFVLALSDGPYRDLIERPSAWGVSGTAVAAVITAGAVAVYALTSTRLAHIDWRWLTTLGALTYPLYLLHEYIGWWLISVMDYRVSAFPYLTLATVIVGLCLFSAAVHRYLETPFAPRLRRAVRNSLEE